MRRRRHAEPKYWEGSTHHWTTPKDFSSVQSPVLLDTHRKLTDTDIPKVAPLYAQITANLHQSHNLATLRDPAFAGLPKLLSGEITAIAADKI